MALSKYHTHHGGRSMEVLQKSHAMVAKSKSSTWILTDLLSKTMMTVNTGQLKRNTRQNRVTSLDIESILCKINTWKKELIVFEDPGFFPGDLLLEV